VGQVEREGEKKVGKKLGRRSSRSRVGYSPLSRRHGRGRCWRYPSSLCACPCEVSSKGDFDPIRDLG